MSSSPIVGVLSDLASVRDNYKKQLESIPEYAAFMLVEHTTSKVSATLKAAGAAVSNDVIAALESAQDRFREHLTSVPEYRALLAIEKLIATVTGELAPANDQSPSQEIHKTPVEEPTAVNGESQLAPMSYTTAEPAAEVPMPFAQRVETALAEVASQTNHETGGSEAAAAANQEPSAASPERLEAGSVTQAA